MKLHFIATSIFNGVYGSTEEDLFSLAKKTRAPCIVFIDRLEQCFRDRIIIRLLENQVSQLLSSMEDKLSFTMIMVKFLTHKKYM